MKTLLHDMDVRLEGEAIGREKGRIEGRIEHLVSTVIKKIQKGKSVEKIAEELEESADDIQKIYDIAVREEIKCDVDKIMKEMLFEK